jgi:hypothetical protein
MPHPRQFSGPELKQLHTALLSGFPTVDDLKQMVRFELDERLEQIAGGQDLFDIVFNLIQWAEARGRLEQLIQAAQAWNAGNPQLQEFVQTIAAASTSVAPPPPAAEDEDQQRRVDAATPAQANVGIPTEVWVQLCLPDSNGFRDELPSYTAYGDEVTQQDVRDHLLRISFPRNPASGELEAASISLTIRAPDFHIDRPTQHVQVFPYDDSSKFIFFLEPHRPRRKSTIVVDVLQETPDGQQSTLGTLPLQTAIRADTTMSSSLPTASAPWMLVALPLLTTAVTAGTLMGNLYDTGSASGSPAPAPPNPYLITQTPTLPSESAGGMDTSKGVSPAAKPDRSQAPGSVSLKDSANVHGPVIGVNTGSVIYFGSELENFKPDTVQPADTFTAYEAGLNLLLARLGSDHARYAEAQQYAQQLQENMDRARHDRDNEPLRAEREAIIMQLNRLSLQTVGVSFAALCAAGCG